MIQSMTGYGKSDQQVESGILSAELRSVNNRFIEVSIRLPEFLEVYEEELKRFISKKLTRGRIRASITLNGVKNETQKINIPLLKKYYKNLSNALKDLGIDEKVNIQHLLTFPDLICVETPSFKAENVIDSVKEVLSEAIEDLNRMRRQEGEYLSKEIYDHLEEIEKKMLEIERISNEEKKSYFIKYKKYLNALCHNLDFENDRVLQEAAILAGRLDITEECERVHSHISQFRTYLKSNGPVGKKMTFLIQELNREITTIGTKAESAEISHFVVDIKAELEKIREQVQNIL